MAAPARFAPADRPRVAVAADGSLAAIHERTRVVVTEVPSCAQFAELGIDREAREADVVWVGTPPRLLVVSRYAAHSTIHLVDPFGPRTIAELRFESPMQLFSSVGNFALAIGAQGAAVLAATDRGLTPYQFPARAIPTTAGAAGTQFVVALPGAIEEWDPQSRLPKRRLKLPRPAQITAVGGSDRVVWMTTQQAPSRVDVLPFVNRGQPKQHELPEPIAHVASHPRSDTIACIGATTGRVYVIDLDGQSGMRIVGPEGIEQVEAVDLVVGRVTGLLAAQTKRPLVVVPLEHHEEAVVAAPVLPRAERSEPVKRSSLYGDDAHDGEQNTNVTLSSPGAPAAQRSGDTPTQRPGDTPPNPAEPAKPTDTIKPAKPTDTIKPAEPANLASDRTALASFRQRVGGHRRTLQPFSLWAEAPQEWRGEIAMWTYDVLANQPVSDAPTSIPIDTLITRYDLMAAFVPALTVLYGAHLVGANGAAPIDIARFVGWPEALGRGDLADKRIAVFAESRVRLAPALQRVLDELPPTTGTLIGTPGTVSLLGPCTIVSAGPLTIIAEACGSSISGAILAAHDNADPRELVAEARAYGAAPMLRVNPRMLATVPVDQPIILVADDDHTADQLGLPRLT